MSPGFLGYEMHSSTKVIRLFVYGGSYFVQSVAAHFITVSAHRIKSIGATNISVTSMCVTIYCELLI